MTQTVIAVISGVPTYGYC